MIKLPTALEIQDEIAKAATFGESQYIAKLIQYTSAIPDNYQNMGLRLNGKAPNCTAKGKMFTPQVGSSPTKAIQGFFDGPTVCECHSFVMAVYYMAIRNLFGDQIFDSAFADMRIQTSFDYDKDVENPLKKVLTTFTVANDCNNVVIGDWIYVRNREGFSTKHPGNEAVGWNLICVDLSPRRYIGLGLGDAHGLELDRVLQMMDEEFNKPPKKGAVMGNLGLDMLGSTVLSKKELADMGGMKISLIEKVKETERRQQAYLDTDILGRRLDLTKLSTWVISWAR